MAESWQGVYSVAPANPLPVTHPESEDPFVFRDSRGHFHLCVLCSGERDTTLGQQLPTPRLSYHPRAPAASLTNVNNDHTRCAQGVPCGGHAWSYDGLSFSNLTIGAFGPVIRFQNGSYWYTAYVERPQVRGWGGRDLPARCCCPAAQAASPFIPQVLQAADGTPLTLFLGMGRSSYDDSCNWAQVRRTPPPP